MLRGAESIKITLILGVLLLSACSQAPQNAELESKEYAIVGISLDSKTLQAPQGATFGVSDEIYGNTGCNNYFTGFNRLDDGRIEILANGGSTKMMCDEASNAFEHSLLANLQGTFSIARKGDSLILRNGNFSLEIR